jgi:hypothetical protein
MGWPVSRSAPGSAHERGGVVSARGRSEREGVVSRHLLDDGGRPLRLFHGTSQLLDELLPSERGLFGAGIYLTTDGKEDARLYGEVVLRVEAVARRPWICKADYAPGEAIDFDSPAVGFIRDVFGPSAARRLRDSMAGDGLFGWEVPRALMAMGHDAIIADWREIGVRHVIVFESAQVRIVGQGGAGRRLRAAAPGMG